MNRLLMLTYTFPPMLTGGTPVVVNLCRYLPQAGWQPLVLTASNPRGMPLEDDSSHSGIPPGTIVRRIPEPSMLGLRRGGSGGTGPSPIGRAGHLRRLLRRLLDSFVLVPDRLVLWRGRMVSSGVGMACGGGADAVLSFGPHHSLHLHALAVASRTGLPCVCFFGDLWVADAYAEWPSQINRRLEAMLERRVVAAADGIVVTTRGSAEYFRRRYGALCPPTHVALNSYDPLRVSPAGPLPKGDRMVVTYTGSFFLRQTPEPFLRGLRLFLERRPDARMEIRLVGGIQPPFAGLHSRMGLDEHVTAMGVVGFDQVPKLQADSHLLLTMVPPIPGAELKCSSKLAEYLRVGRPVMAVAPEGDMTRLVKRLKAGYTCPPKEGAVAECLARAYGDWLKGEMAGPARRTDVERLLDARVTMRGLAGFLSGLSSSGGGSSGGL